MEYILGIDLGTTAIKVGVYDEKGKQIGTSTQEHKLITPSALEVEQDTKVYWECFKAGLTDVVSKSGIDAKKISALSVSAQGETLVPIDAQGRPLRRAIVWMDNRAQEESDYLEALFTNKKIHSVSGQTAMMACWPAPKILWIKNHEPEIFKAADKFLLIEDWFFNRLGAGYYGEGSLWCSTIMWNIITKEYWPEMLTALGIEERQLPKIVESGTIIGNISAEAAEELGLSNELKLVMGGLDQACGAIGVGNVSEGMFSESTGAAIAVCAMVDKPVFDKNGEMPCFYSAIPGVYMIHTFSSGGIAYKWLRDALCSEELAVAGRGNASAYDLMNMQAGSVPAGSDDLLVMPHFQGANAPDSDQAAKCVIYGLSLNHTKAHIIRAFMEGVALVLARMVEATEAMDVGINEVRSLSGGAKSELWCQIKADVLGKRVITMKNTEDAACLGAAILAGVGIGIWSSVKDAALEFASVDKVYESNPDNKPVYDKQLERYKNLTRTLRPFNSEY